ncbi:uncharacterized protein LOC119309259 isoform X1 [Triticum dicoccoides]|uniref:uncharacterized protein n=1 Tax=Triticum aestivum TaxID=4565 RepID=UPI0018916E6B|nr:uncharacterized protein LOC119309259 isoform X1 [Triticum dicoccoides]XP_037441188.1 uncharacterized protein LOC119309259 isoform X1 [Triticum dicoccoides]XP_037441189.1 uncharacterized protein LOC119309259 isoform X1 [Triticum dicoccoides]XP_044388677.1 uncharacterized protein LOC123111856 [Triticum aestivum]XP_044429231.1 uncharacterized protein LOC123154617 [Triticum aestivum]XP_044429232.1 uncharacterized protein LOC123154617 [Triticum aestivum]XP_044429233.1 uncharacterized protein LO
MDIVDHKKEPINKSPKVMSLEETKTSASSIQPTDAQIEIANLRHTKPRRANTNITPQEMRCLRHDDVFLHDDVINAYIYCISAQEHLQDRVGGMVHIASTFVSSLLKNDEVDRATHRHIVKRVNAFLEHDMVFLPVNIRKCHWYLSVINAKKREIQVLDSLGVGMSRSDLTKMLQGLDQHLKIACNMPEFKRGDRWQDLDITNWKVVEQLQEPIQTDGRT